MLILPENAVIQNVWWCPSSKFMFEIQSILFEHHQKCIAEEKQKTPKWGGCS